MEKEAKVIRLPENNASYEQMLKARRKEELYNEAWRVARTGKSRKVELGNHEGKFVTIRIQLVKER